MLKQEVETPQVPRSSPNSPGTFSFLAPHYRDFNDVTFGEGDSFFGTMTGFFSNR
jgi:hypothetical protein